MKDRPTNLFAIQSSEELLTSFFKKCMAKKDGRTSVEKLNEHLKMLKFDDPDLQTKLKVIQGLKQGLLVNGHL